MSNEKYLIYFDETPTSKKYLRYIYRSSISSDTDIGDAIEFDDKETALKIKDYLNRREDVNKYKVMCIKTTTEEVVE